jgi:glycosyltransferase involved in cell wall biosynthesis
MEMHARYLIEHFTGHPRFPLSAIVTKDRAGADQIIGETPEEPGIVFFNSGRWIEDLEVLRARHPKALFVYRTGGNEILKAPLERVTIPDHAARQAWWASRLNASIDLLVTNSAYTEKRLLDLGVRTPFARCVGGVNVAALERPPRAPGPVTIFCAARFVPYKNHALLLDVVHRLLEHGSDLRLRLAGDGPLLGAAKDQVRSLGIDPQVEFLGVLDNEAACAEIAAADLYVQLSGDVPTPVPGGQYLHSEGMGRSVLEALSAGTFVIAGRSGALPEVITPERGLLVDLGSPETIAGQLEPLVAEPPRPGSTDIYAWDRVFTTYEQLWEGHFATPRRH